MKRAYISTFMNKVGYAIITFIANALVTRALGVGLKGEYAWMLTVTSIFAIIGGLGVYHSIPYYNREEGMEYDLVQKYVDIFTMMGIIYAVVGGLVLVVIRADAKLICMCALVLFDLLSHQLNMLLLVENIFVRNKVFITGSYVNLALSILCYLFFKKQLLVAVGITITIKAFYTVFYLIGAKRIPRPHKADWKHFVKAVKFGYIPMLSFLLITLNYKVDVLMLQAAPNISKAQLSFYTTGVSIAELAWFIPDVFKEVLFNKTAKGNNYSEIASVLRVANAVLLTIILGVVVFGKLAIRILYGQAFAPSYEVTVLLFLGIPAMAWFKIIYTLFNAQGRRKTSFSILLISTLINIVMNCIFIPIIGIYGAAVASIFSYSVCGFVFLALFAKISGEPFRSLFIMRKGDLKVLVK